MTVLDRLITQFSRLPGIGRKSASRIVYHLLTADPAFAARLAEDIGTLHDRIRRCSVCGAFTETEVCEICSDPGRDRSVMCVLEQPQDIAVIESSGEYRGMYHVLFGVISPLDGIGPEQLNLGGLPARLSREETQELILATNPTVDGDATALYLKRLFEPSGIRITRLALGLPVGGDLEYADRLTVARSLRGRMPLG
jgi:recombination protein RecR